MWPFSRKQESHDVLSAIETAWRIHGAQADWTAKVDAKAAFAFTLESAAIATVVALATDGRLYSGLDAWWLVVGYVAGLVLLLGAAGLAALVVVPRLRSRNLAKEARSNFIYFGHVRHWNPEELTAALRTHDMLPQLSRQIVNMAEIAWGKHVKVEWSFRLAIVGGLLLLVVGLLNLVH